MSEPQGDDARWPSRLLIAGVAYPMVFFAALGNLLIVTRRELGAWPRPNLDDPSAISWPVSLLYLQQCLLLVAFPALLLGWLGACAWFARRRAWTRVGWGLALGLISWTLFFAIPRLDPGGVFAWFMD